MIGSMSLAFMIIGTDIGSGCLFGVGETVGIGLGVGLDTGLGATLGAGVETVVGVEFAELDLELTVGTASSA